MAESALRQVFSSWARQTIPRPVKCVSAQRTLRRNHASSAVASPSLSPDIHPPWTPYQVPSGDSPPSKRPRLDGLRTDVAPRPFSSFLTDNYAREHDYLRISITERCNLRCTYCMPAEGIQLSPQSHLLTSPEIVYLSSLFVNEGVTKIRLTGGEPTVRKDILSLMHQIGTLRSSGLRELCLTTNGITLHRKLDSLVSAGLTGVNLSLDTLDPHQFTLLTRRNGHDAVLRSINRILEMNAMGAGIKLKINCVVMRHLNADQILPFVELGREKDIEVRFIEYMPFDGNKWNKGKMMSYKEMLALIQEQFPGVQKVQDHKNDTSKTYQVPGFFGRFGFITSMTDNFCGTCNRLRITSDGNLKVCLFGNAEVSLRDILRESNHGQPIDQEAMEAIKQLEMDHQASHGGSNAALGASEREAKLLDVIGMAVKRKKAKHAGMGQLENMKNRPMILIDEPPVMHVRSQHSHKQRPLSVHTLRPSTTMPLHLLSPNASQSLRFYSSKIDSHSPITPTRSASYSHTQPDSTPSQPLPHLTAQGTAHMTPITSKAPTDRLAVATASIAFSNPSTYPSLCDATLLKGDALAVARVAGIMAVKRTADLIPLAHPGLGVTGVEVDVDLVSPHGRQSGTPPAELSSSSSPDPLDLQVHGGVHITTRVTCHARTGVEMEALTAATVAGLTVYDMCKARDRGMVMHDVRVLRKEGGRSGSWNFDPHRGLEVVEKGSGTETRKATEQIAEAAVEMDRENEHTRRTGIGGSDGEHGGMERLEAAAMSSSVTAETPDDLDRDVLGSGWSWLRHDDVKIPGGTPKN